MPSLKDNLSRVAYCTGALARQFPGRLDTTCICCSPSLHRGCHCRSVENIKENETKHAVSSGEGLSLSPGGPGFDSQTMHHVHDVSSRPGNWRAPVPLGKPRILVFDVCSARRQVKLKTPKFLVPKAVKDFEVKFKQFIAWEF